MDNSLTHIESKVVEITSSSKYQESQRLAQIRQNARDAREMVLASVRSETTESVKDKLERARQMREALQLKNK